MTERAFLQPETRNLKPETRHLLAYDPAFDIDAYRQLQELRFQVSVGEYNRLKNQLDIRTRHNLETNLGERFKVEVSQVTYDIVNGRIISLEHDEPFLTIIKRGQKYRQGNGSNETARELAEVEGFAKVQEILTTYSNDINTSETGSLRVIVISPKGGKTSIYQHNFFDIWQKRGAQVIMTRYTSCATYEEFRQAAENLDPFNNMPQNPSDADFLKTPLITYKSTDEILDLFPPDIEVMKQEEYQKLLDICAPLFTSYIEALSRILLDNQGESLSQLSHKLNLGRIYNALLNFTDEIMATTSTHEATIRKTHQFQTYYTPEVQQKGIIDYFGSLPVRQVAAGCGLQSGFATVHSSQLTVNRLGNLPYSVAEFGARGCADCGGSKSHFHCPGCRGQIQSGRGITTCPHCGLTKETAGSIC